MDNATSNSSSVDQARQPLTRATSTQMQSMVEAAVKQAVEFIDEKDGSAGAAAVLLSNGSILTSVFFQTPNETVSLCHETGAFCEAFRLKMAVVATVCVSRENADEPFIILPPCGVCQERLATWGPSVLCCVPPTSTASAASASPATASLSTDAAAATALSSDSAALPLWEAVPLGKIHAYYWGKPFVPQWTSKE